MDPKGLLRIREVAEMKQIPASTIYAMVSRGDLPAYRVGSSWRIRRSDAQDIPEHPGVVKAPSFLVVDPDPAGQEVLRLMLKELKFSRVLVGTTEHAINALKRKKFHGIFVNASVHEGYKIIKFSRSIDPNYPVYLIVRADSELAEYGPITIIADGR